MKNLIITLLLLLIAGCSTETNVLEEISSNPITSMTIAEPQEPKEEDTSPYYEFTEDETQIILGHKITILEIEQEPKITIRIDDISGNILETKNEELINGLKISINKLDFSDIKNLKVTLKIEEFELEDNQYIITKNIKTTIENKDVVLTDSKSTGHINVIVYDKDDLKSEDSSIASGESVELNGLLITNLDNYYKVTQYALVMIQDS